MNPSVKNKLTEIISDKKSGSTGLLLKLIKWCKSNSRDSLVLREMITTVSKELKTFSVIQSFTKELNKNLKSKNYIWNENFLKEYSDKIIYRHAKLFKNALPYLKDCKKIITLSNSETISEILNQLNKHHKVYVTIGESRPQLEGRILAKKLLRNKINVEIIPDALLTNTVEKCDAAVIGADTILSNGDVVNKTGSRSIALACNYFKKPFYVLATSDKFSRKRKYTSELKNGNEIWDYEHQMLKLTNIYFEVVEKKLITKVIKA